MKEGVKAGLLGGMLFEELGIRYVGPIDGHDIAAGAQVLGDGSRDRADRCCCMWSPKRAMDTNRPPKIRSSSTRLPHLKIDGGKPVIAKQRRVHRLTRSCSRCDPQTDDATIRGSR